MSLALETLAAVDPDWLRTNAQPHWFERYPPSQKSLQEVLSVDGLFEQARTIGADIACLLNALDRSNQLQLNTLPEIQALVEVWQQQYEAPQSDPSNPCVNRLRRFGCGQCRIFFASWT